MNKLEVIEELKRLRIAVGKANCAVEDLIAAKQSIIQAATVALWTYGNFRGVVEGLRLALGDRETRCLLLSADADEQEVNDFFKRDYTPFLPENPSQN